MVKRRSEAQVKTDLPCTTATNENGMTDEELTDPALYQALLSAQTQHDAEKERI